MEDGGWMMKSGKFWYHGEPLIMGSLRYRVLFNDILNQMRSLLVEYH